jgi:multiple sugar transport system permease protein
LPLAVPGLATTAILIFIFAWNELLFALTFVSSPEKRTIPVAIALFATGQKEPWPEIFAASAVVTLPLVVLTILLQRKIVSGLTAGSVTGF